MSKYYIGCYLWALYIKMELVMYTEQGLMNIEHFLQSNDPESVWLGFSTLIANPCIIKIIENHKEDNINHPYWCKLGTMWEGINDVINNDEICSERLKEEMNEYFINPGLIILNIVQKEIASKDIFSKTK